MITKEILEQLGLAGEIKTVNKRLKYFPEDEKNKIIKKCEELDVELIYYHRTRKTEIVKNEDISKPLYSVLKTMKTNIFSNTEDEDEQKILEDEKEFFKKHPKWHPDYYKTK